MFWYPLSRVKGEWIQSSRKPSKKPLKRKPCVYDDGNSDLKFTVDGTLFEMNAFCPADRRRFWKIVQHQSDAHLFR